MLFFYCYLLKYVFIMILQLKIIGKGHVLMITSTKAVINAMVVVLFLTMLMSSFTWYNLIFFIGLFYCMWKFEYVDTDTF